MQAEMSGLERREKLCNWLRAEQQITVKAAADRFAVSEMTIRRDLHMLEQQGIVTVYYGGARLRSLGEAFASFSARRDVGYVEKRAIARVAAQQLRENEVVFLDASTTVSLVLSYIPEIALTVVTNSLPVIAECAGCRRIQLYAAPGLYRERYGGFADHSTAEYLSRFSFDCAFFGASAVDPAFGASASEECEFSVKRTVLENSVKSFLLSDHTKFSKRRFLRYAELREYTKIFTDDGMDGQVRAEVLRGGGKLEICAV